MTNYTETDDGVRTVTENYTIAHNGQHFASTESKDTPGWSPYEPCPHCGGERLHQLEIGESEVLTNEGELQDFDHNQHLDALEVSCGECGETLWRHMAVQLIFDEFDDRPF